MHCNEIYPLDIIIALMVGDDYTSPACNAIFRVWTIVTLSSRKRYYEVSYIRYISYYLAGNAPASGPGAWD